MNNDITSSEVQRMLELPPPATDRETCHRKPPPPISKEDLALLDQMVTGLRWRAEIDLYQQQVYFLKLPIVRETPCGFWLKDGGKEVWRSKDGRNTSATRRDAVRTLFHRKRFHVQHSQRRLADARAELRVASTALASVGQRPK